MGCGLDDFDVHASVFYAEFNNECSTWYSCASAMLSFCQLSKCYSYDFVNKSVMYFSFLVLAVIIKVNRLSEHWIHKKQVGMPATVSKCQ